MSELLNYLQKHLPQDEYQKVLATARPAINYALAPADLAQGRFDKAWHWNDN